MSKQPLRKTLEQRFWEKIEVSVDGCWKWKGATSDDGYGVLGRGRRGEGNIRASHVSWMVHNGPIPTGMWILHHCDNPACCRPDHLFLGTAKDNIRDCINKGRYKFFNYDRHGPKNLTRKLSNQAVIDIRNAMKDLPPRRLGRIKFMSDLASKYGVGYRYIRDISKFRARVERA